MSNDLHVIYCKLLPSYVLLFIAALSPWRGSPFAAQLPSGLQPMQTSWTLDLEWSATFRAQCIAGPQGRTGQHSKGAVNLTEL